MNSPFVNFKLKSGISRSLTGAALLLSAAAFINAGESKAEDISCTLTTLSACTGQIGDKQFTGFTLRNLVGYTPKNSDTINITSSGGYWTVITSFSGAGLQSASGFLDYNVGIVGTPFLFDTATQTTLGSGGGSGVGNPVVRATITGISNTPNPFNTDTTTGSVTRNFAGNLTSIAVSQNFQVSGSRRLNGWTTDFSQKVPAPLPLLGAGAAFGFSRRLRSRIKTSAAA